MNDYRNIITIESGKRSGQPCIRGMRITVYDIFEYLASGMTVAEVLHDFPELTAADIRACFAYAANKERAFLPNLKDGVSSPKSDEHVNRFLF